MASSRAASDYRTRPGMPISTSGTIQARHGGLHTRVRGMLALLVLAAGTPGCRVSPAPRPLRIGVDKSPPYSEWNDTTQRPSGLAVMVIQEAARRRGMQLEWFHEHSGGDSPLLSGKADLWALIGITPERQRRFHITK